MLLGIIVLLNGKVYYGGSAFKNTTRYSINTYSEKYDDMSYVRIGKKISCNIKLFEDTKMAKESFHNRGVYLKHKIEKSVVSESDVCFEKDGKTYCLKGKKYPEGYDVLKEVYESNVAVLQSAFDSTQCNDGEMFYTCEDGPLHVLTFYLGTVYAYYDQGDVKVGCSSIGGLSYCYDD